MWAKANNGGAGYDKTNGRDNTSVNFAFDHQLVKLIFTAIPGTDVPTDLSTMTVSINGMNTAADFDLTGATGITGLNTPAAIIPFKQTGVYTYEAVLLPTAALSSSHTVTLGVTGI